MEKFNKYLVIVNIEAIDGVDTPIVEEMLLEESDVQQNYEWADEDKTILRLKEIKE